MLKQTGARDQHPPQEEGGTCTSKTYGRIRNRKIKGMKKKNLRGFSKERTLLANGDWWWFRWQD